LICIVLLLTIAFCLRIIIKNDAPVPVAAPQQKSFPLSETDAAVSAINAVSNAKITRLSKDCISANIDSRNKDVIIFQIREVHSHICGGDSNVAPLITTVDVNVTNGEIRTTTFTY